MYQGKERTRKEMKAKGMKGKEMNIYIYIDIYEHVQKIACFVYYPFISHYSALSISAYELVVTRHQHAVHFLLKGRAAQGQLWTV